MELLVGPGVSWRKALLKLSDALYISPTQPDAKVLQNAVQACSYFPSQWRRVLELMQQFSLDSALPFSFSHHHHHRMNYHQFQKSSRIPVDANVIALSFLRSCQSAPLELIEPYFATIERQLLLKGASAKEIHRLWNQHSHFMLTVCSMMNKMKQDNRGKPQEVKGHPRYYNRVSWLAGLQAFALSFRVSDAQHLSKNGPEAVKKWQNSSPVSSAASSTAEDDGILQQELSRQSLAELIIEGVKKKCQAQGILSSWQTGLETLAHLCQSSLPILKQPLMDLGVPAVLGYTGEWERGLTKCLQQTMGNPNLDALLIGSLKKQNWAAAIQILHVLKGKAGDDDKKIPVALLPSNLQFAALDCAVKHGHWEPALQALSDNITNSDSSCFVPLEPVKLASMVLLAKPQGTGGGIPGQLIKKMVIGVNLKSSFSSQACAKITERFSRSGHWQLGVQFLERELQRRWNEAKGYCQEDLQEGEENKVGSSSIASAQANWEMARNSNPNQENDERQIQSTPLVSEGRNFAANFIQWRTPRSQKYKLLDRLQMQYGSSLAGLAYSFRWRDSLQILHDEVATVSTQVHSNWENKAVDACRLASEVGQWRVVLRLFAQLCRKDPTPVLVVETAASAMEQTGHWWLAMQVLDASVNAKHLSANTINSIYRTFHSTRRWHEALALYQMIAREAPLSLTPYCHTKMRELMGFSVKMWENGLHYVQETESLGISHKDATQKGRLHISNIMAILVAVGRRCPQRLSTMLAQASFTSAAQKHRTLMFLVTPLADNGSWQIYQQLFPVSSLSAMIDQDKGRVINGFFLSLEAAALMQPQCRERNDRLTSKLVLSALNSWFPTDQVPADCSSASILHPVFYISQSSLRSFLKLGILEGILDSVVLPFVRKMCRFAKASLEVGETRSLFLRLNRRDMAFATPMNRCIALFVTLCHTGYFGEAASLLRPFVQSSWERSAAGRNLMEMQSNWFVRSIFTFCSRDQLPWKFLIQAPQEQQQRPALSVTFRVLREHLNMQGAEKTTVKGFLWGSLRMKKGDLLKVLPPRKASRKTMLAKEVVVGTRFVLKLPFPYREHLENSAPGISSSSSCCILHVGLYFIVAMKYAGLSTDELVAITKKEMRQRRKRRSSRVTDTTTADVLRQPCYPLYHLSEREIGLCLLIPMRSRQNDYRVKFSAQMLLQSLQPLNADIDSSEQKGRRSEETTRWGLTSSLIPLPLQQKYGIQVLEYYPTPRIVKCQATFFSNDEDSVGGKSNIEDLFHYSFVKDLALHHWTLVGRREDVASPFDMRTQLFQSIRKTQIAEGEVSEGCFFVHRLEVSLVASKLDALVATESQSTGVDAKVLENMSRKKEVFEVKIPAHVQEQWGEAIVAKTDDGGT